jgi:hypothetical protein
VKKGVTFLFLLVFMTSACISDASVKSIQIETLEGEARQTDILDSPEKVDPTQTPIPVLDATPEKVNTAVITPEPERTTEPSTPTLTQQPTNTVEPSEESGEKNPPATETKYPQEWMNMPVVPEVSQRAKDIYQRGLERGNDPHAFSKVGDCQNITTYFLALFEKPDRYQLGEEYGYLQATIDHFKGSFGRESLAVEGGLNIAAVQSPLRADPSQCKPTESPLACEIRSHDPSIVIISFEEWWHNKPAEEYGNHLRSIIEYVISQGAVPIVATKADNLEGDHSINKVIVEVAQEYEIPLWNFWRAAHALPGHGLRDDGFHLTPSNGGCYEYDNTACLKSGWPIRNLTALQAIYAVWQGVSTDIQNVE